jgi:hypothetical protein
MIEYKIERNIDEIVIFFGTKQKAVNAYTLASTVASLANALKQANLTINPGYDVEILVTDLGSGSFKVAVKTIFTSVKNLFSKENIKAIILSILAAFLYDKFFASTPNINVIVSSDNVVVERGTERIVIPKEVYEAKAIVEKQQKFKQEISSIMNTLNNDKDVESFGIADKIDDIPKIQIPREFFQAFVIDNPADTEDTDEKIVDENTELQITRVILEKGTRKWEFIWHGARIAAPVLDDAFFDQFSHRNITMAPGDKLKAVLRIYQKRIANISVYENYKYEVITVSKHIPANNKQPILDNSNGREE